MNTHIVLTRKVGNKLLSVVVPTHSATFVEDMEGNVLLRSGELAVHIEQSIQDVISMLNAL